MLDSLSIVRLYTEVLLNDKDRYSIADEFIRIGIESMREVYKADNAKQTASRSTVADFNDAAHRCAYLHKYASLHTAMVRDMMHEAVSQNFAFFYRLVYAEERFKICSLGGGPGSDVIGVLATLYHFFSYFPASVSVVDYMVNWSYTFGSILRELGTGAYGDFGNNTSHFLQWRYVEANLLKSLTPDVEQDISSASLVTMIKFVSAASCKDTEFMVKNIFTAMKPGAVLFFIDNDGGGFRELIQKAAQKYNFISIFGPFQHKNYINEFVKVERFGSVSCHRTTVSIHVLQKPPVYEPYPYIPNNMNYGPCTEYPQRRVLLGSPLRITAPVMPENHLYAGAMTAPPNAPLPYFTCNENLNNNHPMNAPPNTPLPDEGYFAEDENLNNNRGFYSPGQSTPLTPFVFQLNSYSHVATPVRRYVADSPETPLSTTNHRHHRKQGCFPQSRLRDLRHRLSRKLYSIKSGFNSFRNKSKKRKTKKSKITEK